MAFLPIETATKRIKVDIEKNIIRPEAPSSDGIAAIARTSDGIPSNFDVAISVAGAEKQYARQFAEQVRLAGFSVFFYEFNPEYLWDKNIATTFDEIFRKRSQFCVIFVSREYCDRVWTSHEFRSAQARAVEEKGQEYILPVRIDGSELAGLSPIGYVPL